MHRTKNGNDLQDILSQTIEQIKREEGDKFDIEHINLAELERRTGISRGKLRHYKKDGFIIKPHGLAGRKAETTVLTGYTGMLDNLLRENVTNAVVCKDRLAEQGYTGSLTQVRVYIEGHRDLIPPKRKIVQPQGNRGRRYSSKPGESYQMDWGFVNIETDVDSSYQVACFAMICHHCGERYVEFFPNAKQENLFIGMLHAFERMGVPDHVLTDNMKSVTLGRDSERRPIWNKDYEQFMKSVGFDTRLCKPRHPFTKGSVERLVQFVKRNFMAGRVFSNITELNIRALQWCNAQNGRYHRCVDCVPHEEHRDHCTEASRSLEMTDSLRFYLCPVRRISFDGFVDYEGRRFGVPYWYTERTCRVMRRDFTLAIYSNDLSRKIVEHNVTWSRKASFCEDQYATEQPEEHPTAPVTVTAYQVGAKEPSSAFAQFNFETEADWDE